MSDTHKDKHKDKRREHMERRREQGVTYRDMEKDFGVSKSKLHRDLQKDEDWYSWQYVILHHIITSDENSQDHHIYR